MVSASQEVDSRLESSSSSRKISRSSCSQGVGSGAAFSPKIGGGVVKERVKRLVFKRIGGGRVIEKVGIEGRGEEVREQELGGKVVREFVEEVKIKEVVKVKVKKVIKTFVEEVEVWEVAEELVKGVKVK